MHVIANLIWQRLEVTSINKLYIKMNEVWFILVNSQLIFFFIERKRRREKQKPEEVARNYILKREDQEKFVLVNIDNIIGLCVFLNLKPNGFVKIVTIN